MLSIQAGSAAFGRMQTAAGLPANGRLVNASTCVMRSGMGINLAVSGVGCLVSVCVEWINIALKGSCLQFCGSESSVHGLATSIEGAVLQRSRRLAKVNGSRRVGISDLADISEGGTIWANESAASSGRFSAVEHRRRAWPRKSGRVPPSSLNRQRFPYGIRNTNRDFVPTWVSPCRGPNTSARIEQRNRSHAGWSHTRAQISTKSVVIPDTRHPTPDTRHQTPDTYPGKRNVVFPCSKLFSCPMMNAVSGSLLRRTNRRPVAAAGTSNTMSVVYDSPGISLRRSPSVDPGY